MNMLDHSLGHLARHIPGAMAVFWGYGLDFSWAGTQTLRDAVGQGGVDAQQVLRELQKLDTKRFESVYWQHAPEEDLIDYILTRYHERHRQQFPALLEQARQVEFDHQSHPTCPQGLTRYLQQLEFHLEVHMRKEEQVLFPMITRGMRNLTRGPMGLMRVEHEEQGEMLKELYILTNGFLAPASAGEIWESLYQGLEVLHRDLADHTHLENNILFERIDRRLAEGE